MCLIFILMSSGTIAEESADGIIHDHSQRLEVEYLTVALVQLDSSDVGDWDVIDAHVARAKAGGAEFVVFPESSHLGWLNPAAFSSASLIPGPVTNKLAAIATRNEVWIAFGTAERGPQVVGTSVYLPYDAGVVIEPTGDIVLHSRKSNVLRNAFDPEKCPPEVINPDGGCNYHPSPAGEIPVSHTPLGRTAILVCADAYMHDTSALDRLKALGTEAIIVVWGVTASNLDECGNTGYNAVEFARDAALYTDTLVIGSNAVGERPYGRYLPSVYCGYSGIVTGSGRIVGQTQSEPGVFLFEVPIGASD